MGNNSDRYLVPCSYCIALLDFISALLFAIISGVVYAKHGNWPSLVALIFTIFWMIIIIVLMAGIHKRSIKLVRFWVVFTCLGIILDGIVLLYGLTLAIAVNWDGVKITVLPFVGLAVEMTFVYIIYLFYPHLEEDSPKEPKSNQHRARETAGYIEKVENEVQEEDGEEEEEEEEEEKPLDLKELKRQERKAKERMKKDKAALKELKKQMRKKT